MENKMTTSSGGDALRQFLEGQPQAGGFSAGGTDILKKAPEFNINLSALEIPGQEQTELAVLEQSGQKEDSPLEDIPVQTFLSNIDVSLKDVIDRVFRDSTRPIVIIRDDRVEYANKTFLQVLGLNGESDVLSERFLKFVFKEDWNLLAENIGEMLTNGKNLAIRLRTLENKIIKVSFSAVYVQDNQHFSFILIGEQLQQRKMSAVSGLYDSVTGLPNFYLLEDRIQVAVNNENYKDVRQKRNMIALLGVAIDNYAALKTIGMHELVLKKLAEKLALSLKKTYTVASGLKYQFWILIPEVQSSADLNVEIQRIKAVFDEPVADNFTEHQVVVSIGVSIFPDPSTSAKKLIEQAIMAVRKAQKEGGNKIILFGA